MNNKLIIGKTGTKKSEKVLSILDEKIENNESILVLSESDKYKNSLKNKLISNDYKVIDLDFRSKDVIDSFDIFSYPLSLYKDGYKDDAFNILEVMGNILVKSKDSMDPFWETSATNLFISIALLLFETKDKVTLNDVFDVIRSEVKGKEGLKSAFSVLDDESTAKKMGELIYSMPVETKGGIIAVLENKLTSLVNRDKLINTISNSTFALNEITKNTAVFITIDDITSKYNSLFTIIIYELYYYLHNNEHDTFNFAIDYFDVLTNVDELNNIINCSNKDNVNFITVTRDFDLFQSNHKKIVGNFDKIDLN